MKKISNFFQGVFTKITNEKTGKHRFQFYPNGYCLPNNKEIDEIIKILKDLKNKNIRKEWFNYFNERKKIDNLPKEKEIKDNSGFIYLIKSKNIYKIGRSKLIKDRLKTYRTENPFGIKIILVKKVKDYIEKEKELLVKFKKNQIRGEWFKLNKKEIIWLKKNI